MYCEWGYYFLRTKVSVIPVSRSKEANIVEVN